MPSPTTWLFNTRLEVIAHCATSVYVPCSLNETQYITAVIPRGENSLNMIERRLRSVCVFGYNFIMGISSKLYVILL